MQFSIKKISILVLLVAMCLSVLGCQLVIDRHEGDNTAPVDSVTEPATPDTEYTPDTPPVTEDDTTEIPDTEPATSEPETTEPDTTEEPELPVLLCLVIQKAEAIRIFLSIPGGRLP